jgi:holo-[acyl-carrier protein] synthase
MLIGIDLCSNTRMARLIARTPFLLTDLFSDEERAYCDRRPKPEQHYGARWAAKEAYLKALGLSVLGYLLSQLEVIRNSDGRPSIRVSDPVLIADTQRILGSIDYRIQLSISHEADYSIAMVVIL